jgi:hypothetical protein
LRNAEAVTIADSRWRGFLARRTLPLVRRFVRTLLDCLIQRLELIQVRVPVDVDGPGAVLRTEATRRDEGNTVSRALALTPLVRPVVGLECDVFQTTVARTKNQPAFGMQRARVQVTPSSQKQAWGHIGTVDTVVATGSTSTCSSTSRVSSAAPTTTLAAYRGSARLRRRAASLRRRRGAARPSPAICEREQRTG